MFRQDRIGIKRQTSNVKLFFVCLTSPLLVYYDAMKTLKLKKAEPAAAATAASATPAAPAEGTSGIYVSSRHANPLEAQPVAPAGNWTWAAIFGIIAFVLFVAVAVIAYMDWTTLRYA